MVSLRNFTFKSPSGFTARFENREPVSIPATEVEEAMRQGCAPADNADLPKSDHSASRLADFTGDLRASLLYLASKAIAERNDAKNDFSGNVPKAAVMSEEVGFKVPAKETAEAFQRYLAAQESDEEVIIHPDAERVIMVHKAKNKDELTELADLFEFPESEWNSLGAGDLRSYLIEKLNLGG